MELNALGEIADQEWRQSSTIRHELELDDWVVMPNHLHGIVRIVAPAGPLVGTQSQSPSPKAIVGAQGIVPLRPLGNATKAPLGLARLPKPGVGAQGLAPLRPLSRIPPRRPRSLATFVGGFKSAVKIRINELRGTPRAPVWQENYHEHIIRNPHELEILRDYIRHNPLRWACDRYNPERGVLVQDVEQVPEGMELGARGLVTLPELVVGTRGSVTLPKLVVGAQALVPLRSWVTAADDRRGWLEIVP